MPRPRQRNVQEPQVLGEHLEARALDVRLLVGRADVQHQLAAVEVQLGRLLVARVQQHAVP
jgi:hypothetical protein